MSHQYRIVLARGEDHTTVAHIYPLDAGAYTNTIALARVRPYQPLPKTPHGDVVDASGEARPGASVVFTFADGTVLEPDGELRHPDRRIFAERDPGVLLHPAITGEVRSWRHARPMSWHTPSSWEEQLHKWQREGLVMAVVGVLVLVGGLGVMIGRVLIAKPLALAVGSVVSGVAALFGSRRKMRAIREARQAKAEPPTRMRMRLWWSVGKGSGPTSIASLAPLAAEDPEREAFDLEVVNVPAGFEPPPWTEVDVYGEVALGGSPMIKAGDVELWPADELRRIDET